MTVGRKAMEDKLLASSEWRVVRRIDAFAFSIRLLERNAWELQRMLHYLTEDPRTLLLVAMSEKRRRDAFLEAVGCLLHNFVASVYALNQHTEKLHGDLYGKASGTSRTSARKRARSSARASSEKLTVVDLFPEFWGNNGDLLPIFRFVKVLRELYQHRGLPTIAYVETLESGRSRRQIVLSKAELLNSTKRWTGPARTFIENAPEDIDIASLVQGYMEAARAFHQWLAERLEAVHGNEYAAVNSALAAIARASGPMVVASLANAIAEVEAGARSPIDALGMWMNPQDEIELDCLLDHLPSWTDSVLNRLAERYGPLPPDLVTRYQAASRRSSPPSERNHVPR